jgi:hypothetical protein
VNAKNTDYFEINGAKANFDEIYSRPDPRDYYRVLGGLDYVIPDLAKTPFRAIIETLRRVRKHRLKVADLGCSYGINAALLRYPLDIQRLASRYTGQQMQHIDSLTLAELDRNYFQSWPLQSDAQFIGIDTSTPAIDYALHTGLIDGAVTTNLEDEEPSATEASLLRGLDLLISTGCIGYTTEKSLLKILNLQRGGAPLPWVASLVLRMFPYDKIAENLSRFGLVTEKLEGVTFVQRRFHSSNECEATIGALEKQGIDPTGKEADGLFHAELYVSRPRAEAERCRLGELISVTSGAGRRYGRRYVRSPAGQVKLTH